MQSHSLKLGHNLLRAFVIYGEGIQCDNETQRFLDIFSGSPNSVKKVSVPDLVQESFWDQFTKETSDPSPIIFFLPGGFSFADHFQSGRLLSYALIRAKFFDRVLEAKAHVVGICNGFQVLVQTGLFGGRTKLEANKNGSFVNRWVNLNYSLPGQSHAFQNSATNLGSTPVNQVYLPVRHGEGRFVYDQADANLFKPFLFYTDKYFNNGSTEQIAGVYRIVKSSSVWGLMPHPEMALRPRERPDFLGVPFGAESQNEIWNHTGDGLKLFQAMYQVIKEIGLKQQ